MAATPRVEVSWTSDDTAAFFREWRPHVVAFFLSYGVPAHDTDDLTQNTFMAMLVQWASLAPDDREGRLWTIAHHRHVDYLRRNARWADLSLPLSEVPDTPCPKGDPASVVARLDVSRQVRLALEHEKPEHQQLLYRRYVEGRRYEDIARELGTTPGALRNVVSRAHERLRTRLDALDLTALAPSFPWLGWRWTRRSATRPWTVAAGHGAFVSLVATTMVMAPPAAVTAEAVPLPDVVAVSTFERQAPSRAVRREQDARSRERAETTRKAPRSAPDPAENDYGRKRVKVPLPPLPVPTPKPPCVGVCAEPAETLTVHLPIDNGEVSQEQNVAPACRYVPDGQRIVTCREQEGTEYAASQPPRPADG